MTIEEVNKEFKDIVLHLNSYYKYSFTLKGNISNKTIVVSMGGNAQDIYRFDYNEAEGIPFGRCQNWSDVIVNQWDYDKDKNEMIFEWENPNNYS